MTALSARKKSAKAAADTLAGSDEEPHYKPIEWPLIRRLFAQLRPHRKTYALGITLGALMVLLNLTGPAYIGLFVDIAGGAVNGTPAQKHAAVVKLVEILGLWIVTCAALVFLERLRILIMVRVGERVQFDLRRKIFRQLQRLSMSYYDKTKLGRIISRCTSDLGALRETNVWGIDRLVLNTLTMIIAAAMILYVSPRLFLCVCWLGPVLYLVNAHFRHKSATSWQIVREGWTRVSTNLAENITGVRVVTAFNRQTPNLGVFNLLQDRNTDNNVRASRVSGIYQPLFQMIGLVGRLIILLYGGYLIATKGRSVGLVIAAFLYWDAFMNPILELGVFSNQLMMAMAGAERIFNLLDMDPDVQDVPAAQPLPRIAGSVEFDHVTFGYNPQRPVLHDVSFQAHPGQMVALVGATGSGKSSIISLIARFYQPQQGRVLVDGHNIRDVTGESLHRQTGLVLQQNYLFAGTVMENIRYAKPLATEAEVIASARAIGSHDAILSLQDGYQTDVGERGANMSLGQRQLICFTRAFLANPRIFMLDEATSAVDTATELLVQESLEKLLAGRTTFIVAHRLSTIVRADMILVIDAGTIVERGTHRELVAAGGKYAALYEQFSHHA
jgi:ATP-binding cassette, subfamily B, bacterial